MKTFNFFERLWEHGRTLRRVGLVLVMCLTLCIPNAWGTEYSSTPLVSLDFSSNLPTVSGVTYHGASYSSGKISWGGNFSADSKDVQITFTTTGSKFKVVLGHITSGSSMTFKYILDSGSATNMTMDKAKTSDTYEISASAGSHTIKLGPGGSSTRTVVTSIAIYDEVSGSTWYVKGSFDSWGDGFNFTGTGSELTATVNITTAGSYEFKINNSDGNKWYGNGGNIGCNVSGWIFNQDSNCKFFASETGNYTFTFNTSTKALSVTYPTAQGKYYYKNTGSWSNVAIYRYVGDKNNGWPGSIVVETEEICGDTYFVTYADPGTTLIFNNNNNGSQTGNMAASGNAGKYVQGTESSWSTFSTFTISYAANGGSGSMSSQTGIACGTDKATTANSFTAPSGYQFAGWKANVDVTVGGSTKTAGTVLADGVTIQNVSSNITLTAQWEVIPTYDVIYNTNGGTGGSTASQTGNLSGAVVATRANGFTRSGYKFKWWNTKADGSGEDFYPGEKVTIASANVNLYAQWEQVSAGWEFWCGSPNAFTTSQAVVGDMVLTSYGAKTTINTDLTADPTIVSKYNSTVDKHAICIAVADNDQYVQVHFSDGSPINSLKLWATTNQTSSKKLAVVYSTTADFSSGEYEAKEVSVPANNAASKALTDFSPATADKYFYARIYRKVATAVYGFTGGSGNTARIYAIKAEKGTACSTPDAPTDFTAGSISATGATFTITDAADAASYDIYYSTESTAPTSGTAATTTSTSKTKEVTGLTAGTTYYAWVRSVCDASHKSAWVALNPGGDTHTFATSCVAPATVNVTATVNEVSGYWFYPDDDVVLTATPTGSPAGSPVTYQWKKNGSNVGTNSATLTINDAAASDAGKYTCTISYGACSTTSAEFELKCMQFYLKNSGGGDISNHALQKVDATHATLALSLTGGTTYKFRVTDGCNNWYGNSDATGMTSSNCSNWTMPHDADCKVTTSSKSATYTFNFDFSAGLLGSEMKVSVVYPSGDQPAGKIIYWDNSVLNWASAPWYRIGKGTHNNKTQMTLVSGTANLYAVTTTEYNGFEYWHIANNDGNGTGNIFWTRGEEEHAITEAMGFEGSPVTADAITVTPTADSHGTGTSSDNYNCEFYEYGQQNGMKTDNVAISPYSNGTITVAYTDVAGVAQSFTSGSENLAHTVIITPTATPATGYDLGGLTVNAVAHTSGNTYTCSGATTIAATFTPQVYSITYKDQGNVAFSGEHAAGHPTTHTYGTATTLKTASKTGYTFGGWFGNSECAGAPMTSIGATSITAGIILYAKWTPVATLYTVTFNSNGGSAVSPITQASEGASITMPTAPTYAGHTFQGWVIGGTTYAAGASYTPTANITAYASWKADCAGGGGGTTNITIFDGTVSTNPAPNATAGTAGLTYKSGTTYTNGTGFKHTLTGIKNALVDISSATYTNKGDYVNAIQWGGSSTSYYATFVVPTGYTASISITYVLTANATKYIGFGTSKSSTPNGSNFTTNVAITSNNVVGTSTFNSLSAGTYYFLCSGGDKFYILGMSAAVTPNADCYYVTYDGNGADGGSVTDAVAHASGSNVTVLGNIDHPAVFTKSGYRFNGWNTSASGNGTAYAAGETISSISADVTLYAQWVADACSAPSAPTISGTSVRTVGQTINLNAECATGADASTTYTWYKGVDWATASLTTPVQAALTAGEGGRIFNKASCVAGDAGTYWCEASNGEGCEAHNATGFTVTVNAAGATHIYYYKDEGHYDSETGTYYNPEGNTATLKDNQALSSPWTICNGCMTGVDSVVAHGATYDGKGNWVNAYIKIPKEGTATTNNIKFALSAGYTGTLTIKIGKYKDDSTVPTASLKLNGEGDAITPTSGSVGGVATTENSLSTVEWPLNTAGGTYILTVASSNAYISQIDMTTETSAEFNVTYNGNGNTGGSEPTDATNYASGATVTVAANTGDGKLVKTNYTGAGWNTANNGTGTNYVPGSGTFTITANTTLYAHWTQLITLAPGTQGTGTNNAAVSWNGSVLRGFAAHSASGYALQGYYTEPSGGTKVLNADGSFAATNIDGFVTSGKWSNTGAAPTLYAQWEASSLLKWNLKVNVNETSITTLSKESAVPTVIAVANMSNLTNNGSLTITGSAKSALTSKIATTASATGDDAGKYMSVQFEVAAGYQLKPSDIKVKVQPISHSQTTKLILEDNNLHSISYISGSISKGSTQTVTMTNSEDAVFTGTVTLKIYVYGTAENDGYRLGTPIEINGSVEATCTPPTFSGISYSATEYTVGASASPISVTGATNVGTYLWKQNDVNDRSGGTAASGTNNADSYTPPTSAADTMYYWCEMTNGCTTVKTAAVGIMVRNATTDPTVTWSDVKLNGETATPNYGGGNYVLRATVNETSWPGTLAASMITAPAGIRIHDVTYGTADSKKYIEFQFDVTTAFDRASNATIDFNLALPEVGSYSALNSVKSVDYTACTDGTGAAGMVYIPLTATQTTAKSGMQNYWETAEAGRVASNYGGSAMSSTNNSTGYLTAGHTFNYYAASTNDKWMFQTYVGGVNKVRVAFYAQGALKSSNLTIKKFLYDTEYFSSQGDREVSIGEVNASQATFAAGENGYIEFTVPEMAANSYAYFVTGSSNMKIYGLVLYTENAGSGGSVETNPVWSGGLANEGTVNKTQSDANFTYTISTTTNTLGAISYSSSNPSVAAVDPVTGEVTITATGASAQSATITATLARSGCYQGATRTYTINVAGYSCSEPSGSVELTSGSATKCESESVTLTMTGFTEGAPIQWYNGDSPISNGGGYTITTTATQSTLTTTAAGTYSAIATSSCAAKRTNSITIANMDMSEQKTVRKVSQWYVKNGRLTPDIALWQLGEGETFKSVAWSPTNGTGLDFVTRNGIVYLEGKEPSTNTSADIPYTLTLTITDACGTDHVLSGQTITLTHQKNTDKHVLAFVVNGTAKGGFTEGITAAQTTSVGLYNAIAAQFDVQATNIYSTDDEQKLREYYSQYDILCITDYPNTQTKGANSKSYVDAIGALIDIRPILTMEAFVSSLANWKAKGISGNPKSPTTRQYTMDLQCKDHEVFSGVTTTKIGEGDEAMYRVTVVDKNQEEYKTLDANYGDGEHKANEGYQYGKKPALQGFTFTEAMSDNDLLPLGLIDDGSGNDLQVGIERQTEMEARLMVLGINSYAMERLTNDGQTIVINALKYLMKKNAEDISDCSVYFDGSDETDPTNWDNELNWGPSYASLPLYNQEVRILKPCVVKDGVVARASGIKIIPSGRINHDTDDASGSLTIEPGGALIVDGKVRAAMAPNYFNATPTTPSNLVLQSNSSAQAALILDNSEGETQATVTVRSKANKEGSTRNWQYLTSPLQETPVTEFFYGVGTYTYKHSEADGGWVRYNLGTAFNAFDAIGLTQEDAKDFVFYGPLAPTGEWNLSLTHAHSGNNLFGNSWTAPIDLKALVRNTDFDGNIDLDLAIYNTGADKKNGSGEFDQATNADNTPGTWHHIPLLLATLEDAGWEGMTVIPAYQAFQLKVKDGASSATLTIDYDKCVRGTESANYNEPLRAPRRRSAGRADSDIEALRLAVSDAKGIAYIYLLEGEQFTEGYDNGWELEYKPNSKYGKLYAISPEQGDMMALARPSLEGTMVGFQPGESSEYTITFNETDGYYYLNDLKMEQSTLIQAGESYTFSVEEGESANRFLISSVPFNKPGIVTGVTNPNAEAPKAQKVIYNDKLYIIRGGRVFSADGQLVK